MNELHLKRLIPLRAINAAGEGGLSVPYKLSLEAFSELEAMDLAKLSDGKELPRGRRRGKAVLTKAGKSMIEQSDES